MSEIDPVAFGELCANVKNTNELVKAVDEKLDVHHDRILGLENHNDNVEENKSKVIRLFKWGGAVISGIAGFIAWIGS